MNSVVVSKYGGSSLSTLHKIQTVAKAIASRYSTGTQSVVVVSARGETTDELADVVDKLGGTAPSRESDQLLATGEIASAAQLAIALGNLGVPAVSLSGGQADILAEGPPGNATIATVSPSRVRSLLDDGVIAVVAGFQGVDSRGDIRTLGRGASDTTAVALAAELDARTCEIHTDVDGVYTADPRIVPEAALLPHVDIEVMVDMAFSGARILHSRSVDLAFYKNVDIRVRNSFGTSSGTLISASHGGDMFESRSRVLAVTQDSDVATVSLVADQRDEKFTAELLHELSDAAVPVEIYTKSATASEILIEFTVPRSQLEIVHAILGASKHEWTSVRTHESLGKVSIIGVGMANCPANTGRMLGVLTEAGIPTMSVVTSQLRSSATVPLPRLADSVGLLHHEFSLHDHRSLALPATHH